MPVLYDLFCKAGLIAEGYHEAGFTVVGFDAEPQPRYPFEFHRMDALDVDLSAADAVHASPPCQEYTQLHSLYGYRHPDLIESTRERLQASGKPWVIENVEGAPLRDYVTLCGTSFPGLRVIRHRIFESSFPLADAGPCRKHPRCYTMDKRKAHYGKLDEWTAFVSVNGGGNCSRAAAADAMGVQRYVTKDELNNGIPPAMGYFIGRQLIRRVA